VVPEAEAQALCVACDDVRADARAMADRGQWEGAAAVVRQHLARIAAATAYHAGDGSPLSEAYEQLLDEAMAYERRPAQEQYSAFRKANRGVSIAVSSQLYGARGSRGPRALDVEADLAGAFPHAHLELLDGPHAGRRHALGADNVLGRTSDADIALESGSVSRRHARVFAHEGRFWLADLGSTNRTTHNGVALGREHVRLASGDRIEVGSVALAYVEG
jgi:Ca-activated chloride channel family protein